MRSRRNRFCRLSLAVASLVMLGAEPSLAQSVAVPCSAFTRNGDGDWKVLAPVMLHIDGRLLCPLVGTTFEPGTMTNGIKMSEVLDRECRSSSFQRPGMGRKPRTHEGDHGTSPGEFAPVP